jgi:TldD protein
MAALAASVGIPNVLSAKGRSTFPYGSSSTPIDITPRAGDPLLRDLAMRALDAAKSGGATYADVRLTVTRTQAFYFANPPQDSENIAVGVRALVNGAWGFVASVDWTPDVMARLGRDAAAQAKGNVWQNVAPIDLGERPTPASGTWAMPVRRDPFAVAIEEKLDYIRSAEAYAKTFRNGTASSIIVFERQERTFASTDGAFCTQTVYNSLGNRSFFSVGAIEPVMRRASARNAEFVNPSGAGYEIFDDNKLLDEIPVLYEQAREMLTAEPADPSRYEVVFDAYAMANIVDQTVGAALELDRALGYEANASGTSYLAPVEKTLGTKLTPPAVTITGNRSHPTGAATVKWDDDGVAPSEFTLIKNGEIVDYATNRELVSELATWYRAHGHALRSNGCAASEDAMTVPLVEVPNLVLQPGTKNLSFEDLIANVDDGVAIRGGVAYLDQQKLNGEGLPEMMYRVKKGKIVGTISGAGYIFRSPDLWKNLISLGGERSAAWKGITAAKGQPQQSTVHSVRAVAAHFKNLRVFDFHAEGQAGQMQMQRSMQR